MRRQTFVLVTALWAIAACGSPPADGAEVRASRASLTRAERLGPSADAQVQVARGERLGFSASASDDEGDLWAAEWYLDGQFLGAQYRHALSSATGSAATFWRGINFPGLGRHVVEMQAFDRVGTYSLPVRWDVQVSERPRVLYLDHTDERIATPESRAALANLVAEQGVNEVALYRLHVILEQPGPTAALESLLTELRAVGVQKVWAVVGSPADVTRLGEYLALPRALATRFDGVVTEYEFWRPGQTFRGYLSLLAHARVLADAQQMSLATYLGWFDETQVAAISGLADIVFLHAYVSDPALAYRTLDGRLRLLARDWGSPVLVYPIFSAELHEDGVGPPFMGAWLEEHRDGEPLESAETTVLHAFRDDPGEHRNAVRIGGFAWFSAGHLERALQR